MAAYGALFDVGLLDGSNGFRIDAPASGEGWGIALAGPGDLNGDGRTDLIIGGPGADPSGGTDAGSALLMFGRAEGFPAVLDLSAIDVGDGVRIDGAMAGESVGTAIDPVGDWDGDGRDDFIITTASQSAGGPVAGTAYLIYGRAEGWDPSLSLSALTADQGLQITGGPGSGHINAIAGGHDLDGDGTDDLVLGFGDRDPGGQINAGSTFVLYGMSGRSHSALNLTDLTADQGLEIAGATAGDRWGSSLAVGDVNGDGFGDLVIGAPDSNFGGDMYGGDVSIVFGGAGGLGEVNLADLQPEQGFRISGGGADLRSGASVAVADLNGDGLAEVIVGTPGDGTASVIYGRADGWDAVYDLGELTEAQGFKISENGSPTPMDRVSVTAVGDWNGDGFADITIELKDVLVSSGQGLDFIPPPSSGGTWVVFGKASGSGAGIDLSSLTGDDGFRITGGSGARLGESIAAGDLNGDGLADLIVGDPGASTTEGAAYVIYGALPGEAVTRIGSAISQRIYGGDFDDLLSGLEGDDSLIGGGGNNTLLGGGGGDMLVNSNRDHIDQDAQFELNGGDGKDTLDTAGGSGALIGGKGDDLAIFDRWGNAITVDLSTGLGASGGFTFTLSGVERLRGTSFGDSLTGRTNADDLDGGEGDDSLVGGGGKDRLSGGGGNDLIKAGPGTLSAALAGPLYAPGIPGVTMYGGLGLDTLVGGADDDRLYGEGDNDHLSGGVGNDNLYGGAGDDTMEGGEDDDGIVGDQGNNTAAYATAVAAVTVSLDIQGQQNTISAGRDVLRGISNLIGSDFNDRLTGAGPGGANSVANRLSGGLGADTLEGRLGADTLDGGADRDRASYAGANAGVVASLANPSLNTGHAAGDSYIDVEDLEGSAFNDTLYGDANLNRIFGLDGDDTIHSGAGGLWYLNETIDGGSGLDTASYLSATAGVKAELLGSLSDNGDDNDGDFFVSIERLQGTNFNDSLHGSNGADTIMGMGGDDMLVGMGGPDHLVGGAGNDTVSYAHFITSGTVASLLNPALNTTIAAGDTYASVENLVGTNSDDTLTGDGSANFLNSLDGDDFLFGMGGADTLRGGIGWDTFDGGGGSDTVDYRWCTWSVTRDVTLTGWQNQDKFISIENLIGGTVGDLLIGSAGVNKLEGYNGSDTLIGRAGADVLDGGAGSDFASYAGSGSGITANLINQSTNTGEAIGDSYISIENLIGTAFNDNLTGNSGNNILFGGAGADALKGLGGSDTASYATFTGALFASLLTPALNTGDAAGDTYNSIENLTGGTGANRLQGNSLNNVLRGIGSCTLEGGLGGDTLIGGISGIDTATYENATSAVTASLAAPGANTGEAAGDTYSSIEVLIGSQFDDTLSGNNVANWLIGGAGADTLSGGNGLDSANYSTAAAGVSASLDPAIATNTGDAAGDVYISIENLVGSAHADFLYGSAGVNTLYGGGGDDFLNGGGGADQLRGDAGFDMASYIYATGAVTVNLAANTASGNEAAGDTFNSIEGVYGSGYADTITGNALDNRIVGLGGADILKGGLGNDVFTYWFLTDSVVGARDLIMDFTAGDRINISLIDADASLSNDQAFHIDGTSGGAGDIKIMAYDTVNDRTVLRFYVDNNASVDMEIWLKGDHSGMTAADFVL